LALWGSISRLGLSLGSFGQVGFTPAHWAARVRQFSPRVGFRPLGPSPRFSGSSFFAPTAFWPLSRLFFFYKIHRTGFLGFPRFPHNWAWALGFGSPFSQFLLGVGTHFRAGFLGVFPHTKGSFPLQI